MISDQVRRGIQMACIRQNTTIVEASKISGVNKSSMYKFMQGGCDIKITKLSDFCVCGLNHTLMEILELGEK